MEGFTQADLMAIAGDTGPWPVEAAGQGGNRKTSSWEITTFLLPMSIRHFRRVLRENPALPQGEVAEGEGPANAMRWFSFEEVEHLRSYFEGQGRRPVPPRLAVAPVIALMHPYGRAGKTSGVLHLAHAAALTGLKVLVIDADPAGDVTRALAHAREPGRTDSPEGSLKEGPGLLPLIARSYGGHLLRANQLRLDQGETPLPMDEAVSRALSLTAQDVIAPTRQPNIDLIAASRTLAHADLKLGDWQGGARSWQPWRALHHVLERDGVSEAYDVILCDTGPGVGPLALSVAASADVLVVPVPLADPQAPARAAAGLRNLSEALTDIQTRETRTARALGKPGMKLSWQGVHLLLTGESSDTRAAAAAIRARFGTAVLPDAVPEVEAVRTGEVAQFYDLPPRAVPRARYVPLREDMDACWRGLLAQMLSARAE